MRRSPQLLLLALLCAAPTSCIHGPRALKASHALHNEALRTRIDEELLLNLVRLRYRDSPLFLQVGTVVTQFEVSGSLGASSSFDERGLDSLGLSAGIGWSEQPTYTFTPLQDDKFVRRMLAPIDLDVSVLLQRSGWSIDRVMRLTMQNIGGLDNATSAAGPTPAKAPNFEQFKQLTHIMRTLQQQGRLQMAHLAYKKQVSPPIDATMVRASDLLSAAQNDLHFEAAPGAPSHLVLMRNTSKTVLHVMANGAESDETNGLTKVLGLPRDVKSYEVVTGNGVSMSTDGTKHALVGVNLRSLLGTFFYLSQGIDIPESHVEKGLVTVTRKPDGEVFDWHEVTGDIFRVKSAKQYPAHAAIAVPYRNHWFYIEDNDLQAKSTFALLLELFNLSANPTAGVAPTLTLPIGR